ncbi:MAG: hypothetical protein HY040_19515 [Planctomycetes bacterium]|nr:hypothetical protein [Planctomycetota bacterium]
MPKLIRSDEDRYEKAKRDLEAAGARVCFGYIRDDEDSEWEEQHLVLE